MFARIAYVLSALLLGASALAGIQFSSAEWTDSSRTPMGISAAPDWTPPLVAVTDPGYALWGTVIIGATASDSISAIGSVEIQYRADASSTWVSLCTDTTSPYSCSWDTTTVTDGIYQLRATALDAEGNPAISDEVSSEVHNTPGVVIDPVASPTKGVVVLTGRVVNAGVGLTTVNFQYSLANGGAGPWYDIPGCVALPGPEGSCSFDTAPTSGTFDMRAIGTVDADTYYAFQTDIVVDNTAPIVDLTVPGGPLGGAVELTATASDEHTSVDSVLFEYRPVGGAWTSCPVDTSAPYSCSLETTGLADGSHEFQATATDAAGNLTTTALVTRVVDNVAPQVTLTVPAGTITGNVELTAVATDSGAGVTGVEFQYRLQGATSWSTCGTDTSSPYACTFLATNVPNGTYDFRAVASDGAGRSTTTAVQSRSVQTPKLDLADLPAVLVANTTLSATWTGPLATSVTFRRSPTGTGNWTNICSGVVASPTATCGWSLPGDGLYFVQATTTVGTTTYDETQSVYVDKSAPSAASITVPPGPLNGVVTLTGTGSDSTTGVRSMSFEYKLASSSTWVSCGTDTSAPFTCDLDTATLTDADYDFRATAFDLGGLSKTSGVTTRAVNSAISTVSITSPSAGTTVRGVTTVAVDATSTKAIANVYVQYKPTSGSTWTTICTDTTSPYSCAWDPSSLTPASSYDLRAVLTQVNTYTVTSSTVAVTYDPLRAVDVQATFNGGTPGSGDVLTLVYSTLVDPTSIMPGLVGSSAQIEVTMSSKESATYTNYGADFISFLGTNLGEVTMSQDFVKGKNHLVTFPGSTLTVSTAGTAGSEYTVVTIVLADPVSGVGDLGSSTSSNTLKWYAGAATTPVKDLFGNVCWSDANNPAIESGTADADF